MRIFRTKEDWEEILREQKGSGKTVTDFCKEKNIHPNMFYRKRREYKSKCRFVKLPVKKVSSSKIRIKIKDIIIEPEPGYKNEELVSVINTVIEVVNAEV